MRQAARRTAWSGGYALAATWSGLGGAEFLGGLAVVLVYLVWTTSAVGRLWRRTALADETLVIVRPLPLGDAPGVDDEGGEPAASERGGVVWL